MIIRIRNSFPRHRLFHSFVLRHNQHHIPWIHFHATYEHGDDIQGSLILWGKRKNKRTALSLTIWVRNIFIVPLIVIPGWESISSA